MLRTEPASDCAGGGALPLAAAGWVSRFFGEKTWKMPEIPMGDHHFPYSMA